MQIESMLFMTALVFLKVSGMSAQRLPTRGLKRHAQEALPQVTAAQSISSCDKQSRILQLSVKRVLFFIFFIFMTQNIEYLY